MKRVFHHLAFYDRLCIAKPFYTTQLAGNTPFCRLKHQRLQKAMLNCFQTWNKANNVVQKRINKNRLQHIFRLKTPQTKKTTLRLQTFDGNMLLPNLPNGNGVAKNSAKPAPTLQNTPARKRQNRHSQIACLFTKLQQNALDKVAYGKFCATKIAVRNVACCKTVAKQQNTTRLKTKKRHLRAVFFAYF